MTKHFPFIVVLTIPIALGMAGTVAHADYLYTYTELTPIDNKFFNMGDSASVTFASAINNQGQIVGYSTNERFRSSYGYSVAALWEGSTVREIPGTRATAISNTSQVAGYFASRSATSPFSWNGTTSTYLSKNNNYYSANAYGINDTGQVVGDMQVSLGITHATLWNGTVATDLGTSGASNSSSSARAINASGQVAGWSEAGNQGMGWSGLTSTYRAHATVWNGTTITDLGTLGGANSAANDINNANQVVGSSLSAKDTFEHATLWNGAAITDLGTLENYTSSYATAINNLGQVVGMSYSAGSEKHMTLWDGTNIIDLNTFVTPSFIGSGWTFEVSDINDNGWIIGNATDSYLLTRAFLLTPMSAVAEPQTYAMLLAGIGLLGFLRQRRKAFVDS